MYFVYLSVAHPFLLRAKEYQIHENRVKLLYMPEMYCSY